MSIAGLVLSGLLLSLATISDLALQGMRKEEQDNDVRLAATQALYNAIEFASTNFRNETERNYLMQVLSPVCQREGKGCTMCVLCRRAHPCGCTASIGTPVPCYQYSWLEECKLVLVSPVSLLLDNALRRRWLICTLMWVICCPLWSSQH